jgi:pimeloyl-ACP methyl ester carboxylesterase
VDEQVETIWVDDDTGTREIAVLRRPGAAPGLFWVGGYKSDMAGSKATALDSFGSEFGLRVTRFDYSGCGRSGGTVEEGTISRWLAESMAVFETTQDEQIVVGSSMGGWLALLMNRTLRARGIHRIKALVLIAPAVDMTEDLMRAGFTPEQTEQYKRTGRVVEPTEYSDEPNVLTRKFIEDGARYLMFGKTIETGCPVVILQGGKDADVPPQHALKLVSHLVSDPVTLTMIPDGDHRLSRDEDLLTLRGVIARLAAHAP